MERPDSTGAAAGLKAEFSNIYSFRNQQEADNFHKEQKNARVAALARELGIDFESARILERHRNGNGRMFDLTRDQIIFAEALEERLAKERAERVVSGSNGSIDWDEHDRKRRDSEGADRSYSKRERALDPTEPPPPLPYINMAKWDSEPVPEPDWTVLNRIPRRQCVLFSGEGAAGKSTVQLHLSAAHVLGLDWLGTMPALGPALFIDAEDDEDVIHRRLAAITKHYHVAFDDLIKGGLHLMSLVGQDAVLATASRSGKIEPTARYKQILEAVGDIKPAMIGIASSANVYAGSEIERAQVQQFISLMTRLAILANGSLTLLSHPSLTGIATDTGLSGNTQWHNAVRARFYMKGVKPENGEQADNDLREIVFKKNNYGPISESIIVRYQNGLFLPVSGVASLDRAAQEAKADQAFLDLLRRFTAANRNVSDKPGPNYAPAVFAKEDEAKRAGIISSRAFEGAMRRLFQAGTIWNEPYGGRPSRPSFRIALKTATTANGRYTVLGRAAAGARCMLCGAGRDVKRIRANGSAEINEWHEACADKYLAG